MTVTRQRTDAELLAATAAEPEAFGAFYRRHVRAVLAYTLSRTRRPELAADLTAEVFAAALEQRERFDARRGPARAWLLTMASSKLVDAARRGRVEDRARRRLGIAPRELTDHDPSRLATPDGGTGMTDFIDGLERDLVAAAERQASPVPHAAGGPVRDRRWRGRRGLAVALAGLLVAGTAAAAVVSLEAEPSKPLAGPVRVSAPNARTYAISLLPEFRAGNAGWCSSLRFSTAGRTTSSGMGCGPARAAGGNMIAGGGGRPRVDVAPPRPGTRSPTPSTAASKALRRAVLRSRPVLLDEAGHTLPSTTRADHLSRGARSRRVTRAAPAQRCAIGRAASFPVGYARVALGTPRSAARLEGRAFASCAYTVFTARESAALSPR